MYSSADLSLVVLFFADFMMRLLSLKPTVRVCNAEWADSKGPKNIFMNTSAIQKSYINITNFILLDFAISCPLKDLFCCSSSNDYVGIV